jgi:5-methylcytosine-specific restriction enzyme A
MRREFSRTTKLAAWDRCKGFCESCHQKIIGVAEYDHATPCALEGEPTLDNCVVLCARCHRIKTSRLDVPAIAKGKRIEKKRAGIKSGRPWACSRKGKWKKRLDGTVVRRD